MATNKPTHNYAPTARAIINRVSDDARHNLYLLRNALYLKAKSTKQDKKPLQPIKQNPSKPIGFSTKNITVK